MNAREKGTVAFVGPIMVMLVAAVAFSTVPKAPSHPVLARVVQTYTAGARFPRTVIIAQAQGAMEARASARNTAYDLCHVGDLVDGVQTGVALRVDPDSCRTSQMSSVRRP